MDTKSPMIKTEAQRNRTYPVYGASVVNTLEFGTRAPVDTPESTSGCRLSRMIRRRVSDGREGRSQRDAVYEDQKTCDAGLYFAFTIRPSGASRRSMIDASGRRLPSKKPRPLDAQHAAAAARARREPRAN